MKPWEAALWAQGLGGLYPSTLPPLCVLSGSVASDSLRPPRTAAHQAPLAKGFSRPAYWSGLPFPPPGGIFLSQGLNSRLLGLLHCRWILYPWSRLGSPEVAFPCGSASLIIVDVTVGVGLAAALA